MKKTVIIFSVFFIAILTCILRKRYKENLQNKKYAEVIDENMTGPDGEKIYIGSGGGRYYTKNNRKIFIAYTNKE